MRIKTLRLCLTSILAIVLFVAVVPQLPATSQSSRSRSASPEARSQVVKMAKGTWDSGWFQAEIYKQLLAELGYQVTEPITQTTEQFYTSAAKGKTDFWVNGWFPLQNFFLQDKAIKEKVEAVGFEVRRGALEGYAIDLETASKLGIKNIADLKDPKIAEVFDRNGNGKADLIGCERGWACAEIIEYQIKAYGLQDTVEQIQGNYFAWMHDYFKNNSYQPILAYIWKPTWVFEKLALGEKTVWLQVPFPALPEQDKVLEKETKIRGLSGCPDDPCQMPFPPNDIRVVANREFLQAHPDIRRLFELVEIPLKDITAQNLKMFAREDSPDDIKRHATEWIRNNRKVVDEWLKAAKIVAALNKEPNLKSEIDKAKIAATETPLPQTLKVVTKIFEPFVYYKNGQYTGFSIDLWKEIAARLEVNYQVVGVNTLAKLLDDVERGAVNVGISGISITSSRSKVLDFSHPYFQSGLQIMVSADTGVKIWETLKSIMLSRGFYYAIGFLIISLLVAAHIIWLTERHNNPDFPKDYLRGIWESFWWAAVTLTTVGYGDKTPKKTLGRLFGLFWMFIGYFIFTYFTATIAAFTLESLRDSISGIEDLQKVRVAIVDKSIAQEYLNEIRINSFAYQTTEELYRALENKEVDAVVYDAPALQHYAAFEGKGKVKLVGSVFNEHSYGIAMPLDSPLRKKINFAILGAIEDGTYEDLRHKWFGD